MVHCSADKLTWFTRLFKLFVCGPSLIPPKWDESGKSFPIKHDVNDKLVSGKPSKWSGYTQLHALYTFIRA